MSFTRILILPLLATASAIAGWTGFKLGRQPVPPLVAVVINFLPGAVPAAPAN